MIDIAKSFPSLILQFPREYPYFHQKYFPREPTIIIPMLQLERIINKGAKRLCLYHPDNPDKCVKVAMLPKHSWQLENELLAYKKLKPLLGQFLPEYEEKLVKTNLGPGLVCELIRNDDGSISRSLRDILIEGDISPDIIDQIHNYVDIVIKNNIPLYDPNPRNFLVQKTKGKVRIVFSDMKTYNEYKPWVYLHLEKVIPFLNRRILKRRHAVLIDFINRMIEKHKNN